jgi:hypothetical protein
VAAGFASDIDTDGRWIGSKAAALAGLVGALACIAWLIWMGAQPIA